MAKSVLYFIAGVVPGGQEINEIAELSKNFDVKVRSRSRRSIYGEANLEASDYVAGAIPVEYGGVTKINAVADITLAGLTAANAGNDYAYTQSGSPVAPDATVTATTVIGSLDDVTGTVGVEQTIATASVFSSTETLVYSLTTAPSGATINSDTGVITYTPQAEGTFNFVVRATIGGRPTLYASAGFNVTISTAGITALGVANTAPIYYHGADLYNLSTEDITTRARYTAPVDVTSLTICCPNATSARVGGGLSARISAMTVEYPAGTFTTVTFNSGDTASGDIPAGGYVDSDPVAVSIPEGAQYWIRTWFDQSATHNTLTLSHPTAGEGSYVRGSGTFRGDLTAANWGAQTPTTTGNRAYFPVPVANMPNTIPRIFICGDSILYGQGGQSDSNKFNGIVQKSLPITAVHINAAISGKRYADWTTGADFNPFVRRVLELCTHVVCNFGTNDLGTAGDQTALIATAAAFWAGAEFDGKRKLQVPLINRATTVSDYVTDEAAQTPWHVDGGYGTFNDAVYTGATGCDDYFDVVTPLAGLTYPNVWRVDLGGLTADGTHCTTLGYNTVRDSGAIDLSKLGLV